jgi:hypothetical protein
MAGRPKRTRLTAALREQSRQGVQIHNNGEFGKAARGPVDHGARGSYDRDDRVNKDRSL